MSKGTIKVWLHGVSGKMGIACRDVLTTHPTCCFHGGASRQSLELADGSKEDVTTENLAKHLHQCDLVLDFSSDEGSKELCHVLQHGKGGQAVLIATTALGKDTLLAWSKAATNKGLRLLFAPNTSLGIFLMNECSQAMARVLKPLGFDIELVESHHRDKKDAPSGTALFLAENLSENFGLTKTYGRKQRRSANEVGIASLRGGSVFGEHEIKFLGDDEELTIKHRALSRKLFATGALRLGCWLLKQKAGLHSLKDIRSEELA